MKVTKIVCNQCTKDIIEGIRHLRITKGDVVEAVDNTADFCNIECAYTYWNF